MAKKKGDWWRIPVGTILLVAAIPIFWADGISKYIKSRWRF